MKKIIGIVSGLLGIVLVAFALMFNSPSTFKSQEDKAISVVGGADGPTSIFLASKVGHSHTIFYIVLGAILMVIAGVLISKKKK